MCFVVRRKRPLRLYTNRVQGVVDLYRRFLRSVNFQKWLRMRIEQAVQAGKAAN